MTGHLRQRGQSGAWYAVIDIGLVMGKRKQRWHRLKAKTKKEAERELRDLLTTVDEGTYVEASRLTVEQYLAEKWIPLVMAKEAAPSSLAQFEGRLRKYVFPTVGSLPLQKLTGLNLQELFVAMMDGKFGKPLKSQTVRILHVQLHKAFGQAVTWGLINKNPSDGAKVKRGKAAKKRVLTADETLQLLDHFRGTELYVPTLIMFCTGMRRGEVLGLRWSDVDLVKQCLFVQQAVSRVKGTTHFREPKTDSSERWIKLPAALVEFLAEHRQTRQIPPQSQDLICAEPDGRPIVPDTFSTRFTTLAAAAGFECVTPHCLRHGHATILFAEGVRDRVISDRLGDGLDILHTVYIHQTEGAQDEAANIVNNLLKRKRDAH